MQRKMTHDEHGWLRSDRFHNDGRPRKRAAKLMEGDIRWTFPRGPGPKLPPADPAALARALSVAPVETRAQRRERLRSLECGRGAGWRVSWPPMTHHLARLSQPRSSFLGGEQVSYIADKAGTMAATDTVVLDQASVKALNDDINMQRGVFGIGGAVAGGLLTYFLTRKPSGRRGR